MSSRYSARSNVTFLDCPFSAPLCPFPPEVPFEGTREFVPKVFELEPNRTCGVDEEIMKYKCHSFMSVYIQSASFGRSAANMRKMCDGSKKDDSNSPPQDCLDTSSLLRTARDSCHGSDSCQLFISPTTATLDAACDNLRREARIDYICGKFLFPPAVFSHRPCFPVECNKWYRYADEAPGCLDAALVENGWVTEDELGELDEEGKKKKLISSLALKLNPEKHTALGLALREVVIVLYQPVL